MAGRPLRRPHQLPDCGAATPTPAEQAVLTKTSCDATHSVVCALAWAHGYRLTRDFYKGDRAVRESGFDVCLTGSAL